MVLDYNIPFGKPQLTPEEAKQRIKTRTSMQATVLGALQMPQAVGAQMPQPQPQPQQGWGQVRGA